MTDNKEDYLKIIYELGGYQKQINNREISSALGVSAPSVSEMVKKLLEEEYLEYTPYKGIKLTEQGKKEAIKVLRRHQLWEVFLVEHLKYSWDEVHEEAEKLEHVTSIKLEEHLDKYLNYPKTCPHGNPIIRNDENIFNYRNMKSLLVGETSRIRRVTDEKELLKYMVHLDLKIGDEFTVVSFAPYNGPITLEVEGKSIIIGREAAEKIYVD